MTTRPVEEGDPVWWRAEQDLLRRELAESELRFRSLILHNTDGILILDESGTIRYANPSAERLLGHTASYLAGRSLGLPIVVGEATQIDFRGPRLGIVITEMRVVTTEWEGEKALLASFRDVTAQRRLEEQLRQAQKMEAIGRLAGGVAHDFNNLLTVIAGYGEMLRDRFAPGTPEFESIDEIQKAAEKGSQLTNQLLAFSRREAMAPATLCLNAVLSGMDKMLHRLISEDIEFALCLEPGLKAVRIDPGQMTQIILNLVVNARDAISSRGVIRIETANRASTGAVAVAGQPCPPGFVLLSVTDNGCGMSPSTVENIFEPFFTTKVRGKGTGLGLSTVHAIVTENGGEISVKSEPGRGTQVEVLLPAAAEAG